MFFLDECNASDRDGRAEFQPVEEILRKPWVDFKEMSVGFDERRVCGIAGNGEMPYDASYFQ